MARKSQTVPRLFGHQQLGQRVGSSGGDPLVSEVSPTSQDRSAFSCARPGYGAIRFPASRNAPSRWARVSCSSDASLLVGHLLWQRFECLII